MHRDYVTNYALDEAELQPKMETSAPWLPSEMRVSHHHDMFKWHVVFSTVFPDSLKWSLNKGNSSELPPTTLSSIQISHWHRRMSSDWTWPQVGSRLVWGYNLAYLEWPIVFCHGFFKKSLPEPFLSSHLVHLNRNFPFKPHTRLKMLCQKHSSSPLLNMRRSNESKLLANPEEASFLKEINETAWCALALAPWKHRTRENAFCPTLPFNTQRGSALLMHHDYVTNYPLDEGFDPQERIEPEPSKHMMCSCTNRRHLQA